MLRDARLVHLVLYVRDLAVSRAFYEGALGLHVLDEDAGWVQYRAGHVILRLQRAADFGVRLREGEDRSVDLTFLVDGFDAVREALEARGVAFSPTLRYAVGTTADFYDPDGHWFSLYEPAEAALSWPSGDKIRALRRAAALEAAGTPAPGGGLDGRALLYLFLFVRDLEATEAFYHGVLELEAVEGGPCKRVVTGAPRGVVKYDAGSALLTTHHADGPRAESHRVTTRGSGGVALAFHVPDLRATAAGLAASGVEVSPPETDALGTTARFSDPAGHLYHLYQPSAQVLRRPAGAALQRILAAELGAELPATAAA
ncbi:MAG TPA: VOC family protein [Longimicrobium sp.]|nr:VOC family protein [Longimicrobium sp.]